MQLGTPRFLIGLLSLDPNRRGDFLVGTQFEDVGDGTAFRRAPHFRDFVNAFDVAATARREEHQVIVGRRGEEMLDKVDRKSTRLNSSHSQISYAVFCLKKK